MVSRSRLLQRTANKAYQCLRPNDPWLAQGAIRFLDRALSPDGVGLEWGSGRSTSWFGRRLASLTSIEHDQAWYETVQERARELSSVQLRYIPLDHPAEETGHRQYDPLPGYVAVANEFADESLDLALVDGAYRQACVSAVLPKMRPGGLLVVDNTDWLPIEQWGIPSTWETCHQSANVVTQTTVWTPPTTL